MKPLNKEERRKAFFNFLMFFMITIGIIITTVSFGVYVVPAKENNQLQQEMQKVEKERDLATSFTNKMSETLRLFDSLDREDVKSPESIEEAITQNLEGMSKIINDSAISTKTLYQYVVNTFKVLKDAKTQIREAKINNSSAKECQDKITDLESKLGEMRDKYLKEQDKYLKEQQDHLRDMKNMKEQP
jgi:hypothetical protein